MSNGEVFSDIAGRYDRLNTILSLGRDQAWRQTAVDRLAEGRILDLGAGTGAANDIFGSRQVVALDPAPEMLALNAAAYRVVGVGEALPFGDETFDAVFSAYVFRNLDSVEATPPRSTVSYAKVAGPASSIWHGRKARFRDASTVWARRSCCRWPVRASGRETSTATCITPSTNTLRLEICSARPRCTWSKPGAWARWASSGERSWKGNEL